MSLRDRLAALGVELHDIIAGNLSQVPQHNANSHEYFAVHYLGVNGENPYLYGGGYGGHFYVSKTGEVPDARNGNTIGVECATFTASGRNDDDETWYFTEATQEAAAKLAACVAMEYGIPLDHILRHGDITTKNCPSPLKRDQGLGSNWTWAQFKERVQYYMTGGAAVPDDFAGVLLKVGD